MLIDEGLELLTEADCLLLLAGAEIGRVGVSVGALPAIFPVNYRVENGQIFFRTGEGVKLRAALDHTVVAFEVDQANVDLQEGWSVLVVGMASEVADEISGDFDGLGPNPVGRGPTPTPDPDPARIWSLDGVSAAPQPPAAIEASLPSPSRWIGRCDSRAAAVGSDPGIKRWAGYRE